MAILTAMQIGVKPSEILAMYGAMEEFERRAGSNAVAGLEEALKYERGE